MNMHYKRMDKEMKRNRVIGGGREEGKERGSGRKRRKYAKGKRQNMQRVREMRVLTLVSLTLFFTFSFPVGIVLREVAQLSGRGLDLQLQGPGFAFGCPSKLTQL